MTSFCGLEGKSFQDRPLIVWKSWKSSFFGGDAGITRFSGFLLCFCVVYRKWWNTIKPLVFVLWWFWPEMLGKYAKSGTFSNLLVIRMRCSRIGGSCLTNTLSLEPSKNDVVSGIRVQKFPRTTASSFAFRNPCVSNCDDYLGGMHRRIIKKHAV